MKRALRFLLLLTAMACTLSLPNKAQAQWEVFDHANFLKNTITSLQMIQQVKQMILQVKNSNHEVEMMLLNLLQGGPQRLYQLDEYYALLQAEEGKFAARPGSARTLDYYHGDLQPMATAMYPGFRNSDHYWARASINSDTALNTISATLGRLHVNAGPEAEFRHHGTRDGIANQSAAAEGNLQALQANTAATLFAADAVHRVEKGTAEIANLQAVNNAYFLQKEAWGEATLSYNLFLAGGTEESPMPLYNRGAGGVTYIGNYQGVPVDGGY